MANIIKMAAGIYPTTERRFDIRMVGAYCMHDDCREFVGLSPLPDNAPEFRLEADGLVGFVCPFCQREQEQPIKRYHARRLVEGKTREQ